MTHTAEHRIRTLGLLRHPEGGWYRETYRAEAQVEYRGAQRSASTAIFFLLDGQERSALHRIDADEQWHHYEGQSLRIHVFTESGYHAIRLGPLGDGDASPHCWVPAGAWFGAEGVDAVGYALVGCTVAPGFEFSAFELAKGEELASQWPTHAALIRRLTQ